MVESVSSCLVSLCAAATLPTPEGVLPALCVTLVLGVVAVGIGLWIGSLLARPRKGSRTEPLQAVCLLHDWLHLDDGSFVCLQCSFRAGSSLVSARRRRH